MCTYFFVFPVVNKDMKVLLLGATGLLGHNVLLALRERGHHVVALVRSAGALQLPAERLHEVEVVEGSLLDMSHLRRAAAGCEAIVNCAGTTDMSLLHYDDYVPVNTRLCESLVSLMKELGIKRLVHVSTANTIGYGTPSQPAAEESPMQPPFTKSYYAMSKLEGERLLQRAAADNAEYHIVIVNPGFMVGAYDTKPSSGKLLLAAHRRRLMAAPSGGKSFVPVGDCAVAVANALTMGRSGERYLLTGDNMSLSEFYALQSRVCGYRQRCLTLPRWLVLAAGRVGDALRALGIATQLSTRNVRQLLVMEYYSSDMAHRELAMPSTPVESAIRDFFAWRAAQ